MAIRLFHLWDIFLNCPYPGHSLDNLGQSCRALWLGFCFISAHGLFSLLLEALALLILPLVQFYWIWAFVFKWLVLVPAGQLLLLALKLLVFCSWVPVFVFRGLLGWVYLVSDTLDWLWATTAGLRYRAQASGFLALLGVEGLLAFLYVVVTVRHLYWLGLGWIHTTEVYRSLQRAWGSVHEALRLQFRAFLQPHFFGFLSMVLSFLGGLFYLIYGWGALFLLPLVWLALDLAVGIFQILVPPAIYDGLLLFGESSTLLLGLLAFSLAVAKLLGVLVFFLALGVLRLLAQAGAVLLVLERLWARFWLAVVYHPLKTILGQFLAPLILFLGGGFWLFMAGFLTLGRWLGAVYRQIFLPVRDFLDSIQVHWEFWRLQLWLAPECLVQCVRDWHHRARTGWLADPRALETSYRALETQFLDSFPRSLAILKSLVFEPFGLAVGTLVFFTLLWYCWIWISSLYRFGRFFRTMFVLRDLKGHLHRAPGYAAWRRSLVFRGLRGEISGLPGPASPYPADFVDPRRFFRGHLEDRELEQAWPYFVRHPYFYSPSDYLAHLHHFFRSRLFWLFRFFYLFQGQPRIFQHRRPIFERSPSTTRVVAWHRQTVLRVALGFAGFFLRLVLGFLRFFFGFLYVMLGYFPLVFWRLLGEILRILGRRIQGFIRHRVLPRSSRYTKP